MCLINLHLHDHSHYKLIIAANRDEAYDRPTAKAHFWKDHPNILAGRDLQQMGTWLGITKTGRFAALTNYRDFTRNNSRDHYSSRGEVVLNFLAGNMNPKSYLDMIQTNAHKYAGFNILIGDEEELFYYNNIGNVQNKLPHGTHGISNHFLNTPWPKVVKGKQRLQEYICQADQINPDDLFNILIDQEQYPDQDLPDTGAGLELERKLSPLFIQTDHYGTRSSTVLLIDHNNAVTFIERTYQKGQAVSDKQFSFQIETFENNMSNRS